MADLERENIAQTLARELPTAHLLEAPDVADHLLLVSVPKSHQVERIELEKFADAPRRIVGSATMDEPQAFIDYVNRFKNPASAVWCKFDPVSYALSFSAVFDEHAPGKPAWRGHKATYSPALSVEWGVWTKNNGSQKAQSQADFALFLEQNYLDITGTPTSEQMLQMATQFEARQDQVLKSAVRLQSGGVELSYVGTDDAATIEKMKLFDEFHLGIPVFRGSKTAEQMKAKLRYRITSGKVVFWYELIRPDKAHEQAARDLILQVQTGIGEVPVFMGSL
jgi:uncharacterized protein YfdQ (DUF2303 family)